MTRRVQSYRTSTGIVAAELVLGGITGALRGRTALVAAPRTVDVLARLGYPDYLPKILFPGASSARSCCSPLASGG